MPFVVVVVVGDTVVVVADFDFVDDIDFGDVDYVVDDLK
jgi:hypothetical protein